MNVPLPQSSPNAVFTLLPSVLPALFVLFVSLILPLLSLSVSPGELQILHLFTHDPLGNTVAGKRALWGGWNKRAERWKKGRMGGNQKAGGEKEKETDFANASKKCLRFSHFHHLLCIFCFFPSAKGHFFFQFSNSSLPPSHFILLYLPEMEMAVLMHQ